MNYVGIDLGTTNSAICSYDGETTRQYKSPEQHDVTPSAIFIDRRGNKYVGSRAYASAAKNPDNAAVLFKRLMGTGTPVTLAAAKRLMTPEECSAEILRTLFGYLPEEIRHDGSTGTVITVPAAFNQMQKDATRSAAEGAAIGRVALMQEPVAAVMSVMRHRKSDGAFLVYDFGGGTLDIAIAEGIAGRVSLLAHGGIEMCGGRDFDKAIFQHVLKPWLQQHFKLPEDFDSHPQFITLRTMAIWAGERAKIELSQREEAVISLPESDLGVRDLAGEDVYLDVVLTRRQFDELIATKVDESIRSAQHALAKAGLTGRDVERIVFVGGPTHYKPLRDRVASELGIAPSTDVNPMTAVAEGAAVFAESVDWSTESRGRKNARGTVRAEGPFALTLNFLARTPDSRTRIVVQLGGTPAAGAEFQIDSLDTGWSSGHVALRDGATVEVTLSKPGDNTFKLFVFDSNGGPVSVPIDRVVITRTAASIDAIPASHSIAIEVQQKLGGRSVLDFLVKEGDQLPKKGRRVYKAAESLRAGSSGSINFKVWEGDVVDPLTDNRFIGMVKVTGVDFEEGVIPAGAELICDYELRDSGQIQLDVTIPCIGGSFAGGRNFYSRQEGQIDYSKASKQIADETAQASERVDEMAASIDDPRLEQARERLARASSLKTGETDPEKAKQALDDVQEVKRLLAETRKEHLKEIRQLDLDRAIAFFDDHIRKYARQTEQSGFENLSRTAQRSIDNNSADFEAHLDELRSRNFQILWRQDWFVIDRFKKLSQSAHLFPDGRQHAELVQSGMEALNASDIEKLRKIVWQLDMSRVGSAPGDDMMAGANILVG